MLARAPERGARKSGGDGYILEETADENKTKLWKASDLTPLGSAFTGAQSGPFAACSDGLNFWIVLKNSYRLARL